MEIQHWSHPQHPLRLRDDNNNKIPNQSIRCGICRVGNIVAPFYVCEACGYYAHKSCVELPHQINHHFHPSDPLTLRIGRYGYCDSCHKFSFNYPLYWCSTCNFYMDVECALMRNSKASTRSPDNQVQSIQHSTHPHLLLLVDTQEDHKCVVCSESGSGGVYYGCSRCKYFVHKQCLNQLPQQTKYPLHRHHHLALRYSSGYNNTCSLCKKYLKRNEFTFRCCQCHFQLCLTCGTTVNPHIKYEDHDHLLYLVEKTDTQIDQCDGYDVYCQLPSISNSNEINFTRSSILSCEDCDFKIHLLCGPLPFMITHECHIHSLILVDSLTSGKHSCNVCGTKRNPSVRVYYCEKCEYIAHVHCVISEIIKVLRGDHPGNVELKTIWEDAWKSTSQENEDQAAMSLPLTTLKGLLDKLTGGELWLFEKYFYWDTSSEDNKERDQEVISTQNDELIRDEDIDELLQFSNFTERELKNLVSTFSANFYKRKLEIKSRDLKLKLVDVKGGYKVPFVVAPILRKILDTYGDISQRSRLSLEMKSILLFFICKVMKEIHTTFYTDITKRLLLDWYHYMEFVSYYSVFEIGFLKALLEKRTRAFFCLQLHKLEMDVPKVLNKKMAKLKAQMEMCNKFHDAFSSRSEFVKKCLKEATKLKWKTSEDPFK